MPCGFPMAPKVRARCGSPAAALRVAKAPRVHEPRLLDALMQCDIPVRQILRVLNSGFSAPVTAKKCQAEYRRFSNMETPYGKVATTLRMPLVDGTSETVYINNPFALLYAAAVASPRFAKFLVDHTCQFGKQARIVIYSDATTPGNQHRPGNARTYECMQWTFCELPTWFRERKHGWFKFGYVLAHTVEKLDGGMPALMKKMVEFFFHPSDFNFSVTGAKIPVGSGSHLLYANFGFFLEDEKAAKVNLALKGAGGARCCALECMNVVGAHSYPPDGHFMVRFHVPDRHRWQPHTKETFSHMLNEIESVKDDSDALDTIEIATGVKYDPACLLWDPYLRDVVGAPHCHFWDAMHCLFSSGGIVQYQLNGYILALGRHGITCDEVDAFLRDCKGVKLPKTFFAERIVRKDRGHIKAFASECIDAVRVLGLFTELVVVPSGRMVEDAECFRLVVEIVKLLSKADDVPCNVDLLEELLASHQALYNGLYHTVPKNHFARHIVDCVRRHKVYMSCYAPERDHSASKGIAHYAFRNCTKTILDRSNYSFFTALQDSEALLRETYLVQPVVTEVFGDVFGPDATALAATTIVCKLGTITRNTYVWMYDALTQAVVLRYVVMFVEIVRPPEAHGCAYVLGRPMERVGPISWRETGDAHCSREPVSCMLSRAVVHIDAASPHEVHARV